MMGARSRNDGQAGYALPVVLYLLAAIAVGVTAASSVFLRVGSRLSFVNSDVRFSIDALTMEARAAHLLASEPLRQGGVEVGGARIAREAEFLGQAVSAAPPSLMRAEADKAPLAGASQSERGYGRLVDFDGRPYRIELGPEGARAYRAYFQDAAGLLDINRASEEETFRLLVEFGVSPLSARRLAAHLGDFLDTDDDVRFSGAERSAYRRAGLRGPPNARISARSNVFDALEWRGALAPEARRSMMRFIWAAPDEEPVNVNVNTAPAVVLRSKFDLQGRSLDRALGEREGAWFLGLDDFSVRTGTPARGDSFTIYSFPARSVRLVLEDVGRAEALESALILAPGGADRPVFVMRLREYAHGQPPAHGAAGTALPELPEAASLFSR